MPEFRDRQTLSLRQFTPEFLARAIVIPSLTIVVAAAPAVAQGLAVTSATSVETSTAGGLSHAYA